MGASKFSFFIVDIILLIVFYGMIKIVFRLSNTGFLLELIALLVLLFAAFIALIPAYGGSRGGWGFLSAVFLLIVLDVLVIFLRTNMWDANVLASLVFAAFGLIISVMNITREEEPVKEEKEETVYTNFEPGKYVASKTGSTYHTPKCDWAGKIKKKNQVWFDDEKEAKKKYKPHSCIK
jgi:hypothetical protein